MQFDLVIMNPPFTGNGNTTLWRKFVEHALAMLSKGGKLIAVLPQKTGCKWNETLVEGIEFPNAKGQLGRVVVMKEGEVIPTFTRSPVGKKQFLEYGVSVNEVRFKKGEALPESLCQKAVYWQRTSPNKAFLGDAWNGASGYIKVVTGPTKTLESLVKKMKDLPGYRNDDFQNGELLDLVKELSCSSTS